MQVVCAHCGRRFQAQRSTARYCSDQHRMAAAKARKAKSNVVPMAKAAKPGKVKLASVPDAPDVLDAPAAEAPGEVFDTVDALKNLGIGLRYTAAEVEALKSSGIDVVQDQFVGAFEAVKRLSGGIAELNASDPRFSAIVEQLGWRRFLRRRRRRWRRRRLVGEAITRSAAACRRLGGAALAPPR